MEYIPMSMLSRDTRATVKRAIKQGVVTMTDYGEPTVVLVDIDEYRRLKKAAGEPDGLLPVGQTVAAS